MLCLNLSRYSSASISINDNALWITGGQLANETTGDWIVEETEIIYNPDQKTMISQLSLGPTLPIPLMDHCIMSDGGKIIITGGITDKLNGGWSDNVYIYDEMEVFNSIFPQNVTVEEGPKNLFTRSGHGCTIFNSPGHDNR